MRIPYDEWIVEAPRRKRKRANKQWYLEETFSYQPVRAQKRYEGLDDEIKLARRRKLHRKKYHYSEE